MMTTSVGSMCVRVNVPLHWCKCVCAIACVRAHAFSKCACSACVARVCVCARACDRVWACVCARVRTLCKRLSNDFMTT